MKQDKIEIIKKYYQNLKKQKKLYSQNDLNNKRKNFQDQFNIEQLKTKSAKDLLKFLFLNAGQQNSVGYHMESGLIKEKHYFGTYGQMQAPLMFSRNAEWVYQDPQKHKQIIIEENEALAIAEKVKEKLIYVSEIIESVIAKKVDYSQIKKEFDAIRNDINWRRSYMYFRKYLFNLYPEILSSYIKSDSKKNLTIEKLKEFLEVNKSYYEKPLVAEEIIYNNFPNFSVDDVFHVIEEYIVTNSYIQEKSNLNVVETNECMEKNKTNQNKNKNLILYGPPGTGKTYNTEIEAIKIIGLKKCFKDWFRKTSKAENIEKTLSDYLSHINKINTDYLINDNIFSYILLDEYELLQERILSSDYIKNDKTKLNPNSYYQHALKRYYEFLKQFTYNDIQTEFKRLKKEKQIEFVTFHQSYSYEEFVEGIKPDVQNKKISYKLENGLFKNICNIANANKDKKFILVIDEINRGNISKIFGELITLIEDDKRENLSVTLPYSKDDFTVPQNLYIIGTMNTSDRSIASVDIALRRRFKFKEMMPTSDIIGFREDFKERFEILNRRISFLLDRDHQIGHSYFLNNEESLENIWYDSVIPLLNEYFYGDWDKLQNLLGIAEEENKDKEHKYCSFIKKISKSSLKLNGDTTCLEDYYYDFVPQKNINFERAMNNAFGDKVQEETNADS